VTSKTVANAVGIGATAYPPWFSSRSAALAQLAAYKAGNIFQIPQMCTPADPNAGLQDCTGYWINYVAGAASKSEIDAEQITGTPDASRNPAPLSSYVANFITGLTSSLGVSTRRWNHDCTSLRSDANLATPYQLSSKFHVNRNFSLPRGHGPRTAVPPPELRPLPAGPSAR
jgi:hypothetical protein